MSRRRINENLLKLKSLVSEYSEHKKAFNSEKTKVDKLNEQIKEIMSSLEMEELIAGDIKVTLEKRENQGFNELQAIEILKNTLEPELLNQVIKTREYIDNDALEVLTYEKKIDAAILKPCITEKPPTLILRLGKVKKTKEE